MEKLRIITADDERPAREFLKTVLREFEDAELVGEAENGADAVELIKQLKPDQALLDLHFGRTGRRLYELSRGIDGSPVVANRPSKSISAEDTLEVDIPLGEAAPLLGKLAEKVWTASRGNARMARTVVLKVKTREFQTLTRSLTPPVMPSSAEELAEFNAHIVGEIEVVHEFR